MGFIKFYWMVFREAFRHSLDLTQAVLFVVLGFAGLIVSRNSGAKMIVEALDLGGWKIAALVFGSIVAIRLILSPYWLYKAAQARIVSAPGEAIDYGFRLEAFRSLIDKKKAIQVGLVLQNSLDVPIKYEVEDILVTINGMGSDNPTFDNMGGTVSKRTSSIFDYAWIFKVPVVPGMLGVASITYKYGVAGKPFARRAKYVCISRI